MVARKHPKSVEEVSVTEEEEIVPTLEIVKDIVGVEVVEIV